MRNLPWIAVIASGALAASAYAQTGRAGGASAGAQAKAPASAGSQMATSHAETARRLMSRQSGAAADPRLAAATKAANQALLNDPTLKAMVDGSMSRPPSLGGGAPVQPPRRQPPP
jgi:hypothetical protein